MKNYFLLFLTWLLIYNTGSAQFEIQSFRLDSFHLPELDRKALTIYGSLNSYHNSDNSTEFTFQSAETQIIHSQESQIASSQSVNYSHYQNRPDLQAFFSFFCRPDFSFYNEKNDDEENIIHNSFSPELSLGAYHRKYNGNRFFELGYSTSIFYNHRKNKGGNPNFLQSNSIDGDVSIDLAIGHGRLEPISDLSLALFMLQDAVKLGVNGSSIQQEDVYEFAQVMAKVQNERVFDSREKRIYELRNLYDFMASKGWVVSNDPGFFTVLTDNWFFTTYNFRDTGKRWRFGFTPEYILDGQKTIYTDTFTTKRTDHTVQGILYAQFEKNTPVNVHQDNFRSHELSTSVYSILYGDNSLIDNSDNFQLDFKNSIGRNWYPNSRTQIGTLLELDYLYNTRLDGHPTFGSDDRHGIITALSGKANYFISYRAQLNVSASISYSWNTSKFYYYYTPGGQNVIDDKENGFRASLNATISVALF